MTRVLEKIWDNLMLHYQVFGKFYLGIYHPAGSSKELYGNLQAYTIANFSQLDKRLFHRQTK